MIAGLFAAAGAVGAFVALGAAMGREVDRSHSVRPVPPRPASPADPVAWVDPQPVDPDAPWRDPEAVAA